MSKIVDKNTFWSIKENPLSDEGVYMYSGKMIGDKSLNPDELYPVYRPAAELEKSAETFEAIPFIEDHEMIGGNATDYDKRPAGGVVTNLKVKDGRLFGDLKIFSEKLKRAIENGKKELSLGYRCIYEKCEGVFNGKAYKYIQKNLIGNHLALVAEGRMGSEVRVYDSFTSDSLEIDTTKNITKEIIMSKGKDGKACDEFVSVEALYKKFPNEKEWIDSVKYKRNEDESEEGKKKAEDEKSGGKEKDTGDENVDKRKLIDEVGGILKGKVSEEVWRTVIGKIEKASYNKSETGKADDKDEEKDKAGKKGEETKKGEDEEPEDKDDKKEESKGKKGEEEKGEDEESKGKESSSMDAAEKSLKARFRLGEEFAKIICEDTGTFDHSEMTLREIADYGCKKLGLDSIEGDNITKMSVYSKTRKTAQERYVVDSAQKKEKVSRGNKGILDYLNKQ